MRTKIMWGQIIKYAYMCERKSDIFSFTTVKRQAVLQHVFCYFE